MSGFDSHAITFTEPYHQPHDDEDAAQSNYDRLAAEFREFILNYQNMRGELIYRNQLKRNVNLKRNYLIVNLGDVRRFRESLADEIVDKPLRTLGILEAVLTSISFDINSAHVHNNSINNINANLNINTRAQNHNNNSLNINSEHAQSNNINSNNLSSNNNTHAHNNINNFNSNLNNNIYYNDNVNSSNFQVILRMSTIPSNIRQLKSEHVGRLTKIRGVATSVTAPRVRAQTISLQCRSCKVVIPNIVVKNGNESILLPRKCVNSNSGAQTLNFRPMCPLDPFFIIPEKSRCTDSQIIKLQESPETTPPGEMPRNLQLYLERNLIETVKPGDKITVIGVYSIKKAAKKGGGGIDAGKGPGMAVGDSGGVRKPYLIVLGLELDYSNFSFNFSTNFSNIYNIYNNNDILSNNYLSSSSDTHYSHNFHIDGDSHDNLLKHSSILGGYSTVSFRGIDYTNEEIEQFHRLSHSPNLYHIISKSIAPSIYGSEDIKKAIACLLFGGSQIKLPDGLSLRGDINVLLLGDPGTAKSQLLKFVEKAAPIAVYTSGKGSSAAGLTASINRDSNGGFVIEGGAMVLADGGVVCIDEFDKMREDDRVAIHEAMEQQTISIAKAGITTTLNSRCAVLAAANSVFGRWDDLKGSDNINFLPSILSRFDMIFIVKDEHSEEKDMRMAKHVLKIHMNTTASVNNANVNNNDDSELSIEFLKKYIDYCRKTCGPRLSSSAAERLRLHYVKVRGNAKAQERTIGKRSPIVITVRQLEAISRIAESLAKMRLAPFVSEEDVEEAIRLFHISTWDAANRGGLNGAEGFTGLADLEEIRRIESQLKQRFAIGTQVSYQRVVEDLIQQVLLFNYSDLERRPS